MTARPRARAGESAHMAALPPP